jgi:hypothetical protein
MPFIIDEREKLILRSYRGIKGKKVTWFTDDIMVGR